MATLLSFLFCIYLFYAVHLSEALSYILVLDVKWDRKQCTLNQEFED